MEKRKVGFEGVDELFWPPQDTGAFGYIEYGVPLDGPIADWFYDSKKFMEKVKNFGTVVQAGGNCGMYPRFYSKYFKTVHTFEPDPDNYSYLKANCENFPDIHTYEVALGSSARLVSMNQGPSYNVGMHTISMRQGDIKMITLDSLKLKECDLIHYDIEGYEEEALLGSLKTIEKFSPVIVTERGGGKQWLETLGYSHYKQGRMDTVYIRK